MFLNSSPSAVKNIPARIVFPVKNVLMIAAGSAVGQKNLLKQIFLKNIKGNPKTDQFLIWTALRYL